jgi:predicted MPP superfamily phosphohydrolase
LSLDLTIGVVCAAAQAHLMVLFFRRIKPRLAWLAGFVLFEILIGAGYLSSVSHAAARSPNRSFAIFAAAAYSYLLTSSVAVAVYTVFDAIRSHLDAGTDQGRRRALNAAGSALVAAPFAAMGYGALIERTRFEVRQVDVPFARLPADLDGLRILHLSDIHLGLFLSERELARVVDASRELRPHVAFMTGDFISAAGDPLEACIRQLARVKADGGMFGCLGNHERYARAEGQTATLAAQAGIPILRGHAQQLRWGNSVLNVAGVDYQRGSSKDNYLLGAQQLIYPEGFNVLLSHNPDVFPVAAGQGYNLLLSGHTHGGQVTFEILDESINPARFYTPFVRGLYRLRPEDASAAAYVTPGIGTIGIPARIGAPPEISLLTLRKA